MSLTSLIILFILFIILIISDLVSITTTTLIIIKGEKTKDFIAEIVSTIIVSILSIVNVSIFGIHALYFRKTTLLLTYIIISILFIIIYFGLTLWIFLRKLNFLILILLLIIMNIINGVFYLITAIAIGIIRNIIIKDSERSPLSVVDSSLTEEMYKNILNQGKNPNDSKLVEEFDQLFSKSRESSQLFQGSLSDDKNSSQCITRKNSNNEITE